MVISQRRSESKPGGLISTADDRTTLTRQLINISAVQPGQGASSGLAHRNCVNNMAQGYNIISDHHAPLHELLPNSYDQRHAPRKKHQPPHVIRVKIIDRVIRGSIYKPPSLPRKGRCGGTCSSDLDNPFEERNWGATITSDSRTIDS